MAKFDNHMIFRVVLIVLAAVVLFFLIQYYTSKQTQQRVATERYKNHKHEPSTYSKEGFEDSMPAPVPAPANPLVIADDNKKADGVHPSEETDNSDFRAVDFTPNNVPSDCFPRDRLTAEDLLPGDSAANSKWAQVNPAGQGDVSNQNFLTAGWAVGINTVSGTLRNANLQLRSEPPNPRSAWPIMNSTIEADPFRRPLEIAGEC